MRSFFAGLAALAAIVSLTEGVMVCYYGSWAVYRQGNGKFDVEQIDPFLCTHIVFGFAGLGSDNKIAVLDPWNELCDNYGKCAYDRFTALKNTNPNLIATLAVGGWNEGSTKYSNMAKDPAARATFVQSAVDMLIEHDFDGLDMDWEYPTQRGGAPEDKANFILLMNELRDALHAQGLILTAAVSAGKATIDEAYDVPALAEAVDLLHVMTYDMHGAWDTYTHHQTILYAYPLDAGGDNEFFNVDYAIQYWISLGAPRSKIAIGLATYARCWRLDSADNTGMYAPASQPGSAGPYTRSPGFLGYNELCEHEMTSTHWTIVMDPDMNEPYAYDLNWGNTWCSYDSPESLATKATYAADNQLAGLMVWSIETDDFLAQCHPRPFHLIKTAYETYSGIPFTTPPPPSTTTRDPSAPTEDTTTVAPPTTVTYPTAGPGEHCSYPGPNPDPVDCSFFYLCAWNGSGYDEYITYCGEGALFNPEALICDYDFAVCALGPDVCPANCPLS